MRAGGIRRPGFLAAVVPGPAEPGEAVPAPFARKPSRAPAPAAFHRPPPEPGRAPGVRAPVPAAGPAPAPVPEPAAPPPPARLPAEYLHRLAVSIDTLRLHADRLTELCADDAIVVGTAIARRILEAELATAPEKLLPLIRSALRKVGESREVVVRLSPADADAWRDAGSRLAEESPGLQVRVVADPALGPGDVQVDADFGTVDGRLETRLAEVRQALAAAVSDGGAA